MFAAVHALRAYNSRGIYSFIPKNGCTALRYALAIDNGCLKPGDDPRWVDANNATFLASLPDLILADYTFVVLRCPYRRLASAFLDKITGEAKRREVFLENSGISSEDLTFRRFAESMRQKPLRRLDHHWAPQTDFLIYEQYDDVFCLEAFDAMVMRLEERIGLKVVDVRPIVRHGLDSYSPVAGQFADVLWSKIADMRMERQSPTAASLYDDELLALVGGVYAEDVALHKCWSPPGSSLGA